MNTFTFWLHSYTHQEQIPGQSNRWKVPKIEVDAENIEEAWIKVEPQIPENFRVFCWGKTDDKTEEE
jgi:hypothetical protein